MESLKEYMNLLGEGAKRAAYELSLLPSERKNEALLIMARRLETSSPVILEANARDMKAAGEKGVSPALLDRLLLTPSRISAMAEGLRKVAGLPDPVGQVMDRWERPNGLEIVQVRVPIGVIGMIYESRPNVTADASALCLKAGNAVILKGGSDALHSNKAIADCLKEGLTEAGLSANALQLIESTDREAVVKLCRLDKYLDLLIPRGGRSLIEAVVDNARVPVIKHYDGICHLYVDDEADLHMALDIADDAKSQKPGVCNALETVLVHSSVAERFLPLLALRMRERNVELRACARALSYLEGYGVPAVEEDWSTEYLDLILSVKIVDSLEEAVSHINRYGSHHSESIVTASREKAADFMRQVQSACVYHNASTRFSDGEEYGFGAEIGISTDKLHARGPMGLRELTSYQYRVSGSGQVKDSERLK